MLPIGDDNHDRTIFPWVTVTLIVINALVFIGLQGAGSNDRFTNAFATVPREIATASDIVTQDRQVQVSTIDGPVLVTAPGLERTPIPVYLTLITAMFMHGSWAHLLGNMWFLWIFGDNIEQDLGRVRYTIFYLLTGLLAGLAHVFSDLSSTIPCLGASGAISGVLGAYLLLHWQRQVRVLVGYVQMQVPGFVAVGFWFVFQVIQGLGMLGGESGGVAYGAHIGGFVAGVALIYPFMIGRPPAETPTRSVGNSYESPKQYDPHWDARHYR